MSEKRKKVMSVCLKNGANGNSTLEFYRAEDWGGPERMFRLRLAGKWVDGVYGDVRFFLPGDALGVVFAEFFGEEARREEEQAPDIPRGSRVLVPNGTGALDGTTTITPPFKGYDGRWWVWVYLFEVGASMVPVDDVVLKRRG